MNDGDEVMTGSVIIEIPELYVRAVRIDLGDERMTKAQLREAVQCGAGDPQGPPIHRRSSSRLDAWAVLPLGESTWSELELDDYLIGFELD